MLLIMIPLAHSGMLGSWWRTLPPLRAMGWLLASFVVLSAAAAAVGSLTTPAALAVCALVGLVNARAWYGVAAAVSREALPADDPRARRRHLHWPVLPAPVSPVAAAVALALLVGATRLIFVVAGTTPLAGGLAAVPTRAGLPSPPGSRRRPRRRQAHFGGARDPGIRVIVLLSVRKPQSDRPVRAGPSVLLRRARCRRQAAAQRLRARRHGPAAVRAGRPDRPAGVEAAPGNGRPVDIVAESEGTLGVYAMLARHPDVPVRSVVLLSPIVDPGQADQGDRAAAPSGSGDPVSGDALTQLVKVAGALSPFGSSGAQRLIGSVRSDGAAYAAAAVKNGQKIRWLAVVPLADAVTLPVCDLPGNVIVVSALHGSLLGDYGVDRMAHRFLVHEDVAGTQQLRDTAQVIAAAAAAWRMPVIGSSNTSCTK